MTPDDARKLVGGYATGSLTEAERKALFEAALEDQELFDELAGEQVLKEVLDEPGARQRLLMALEPPRKHRAWIWVSAAATLAIAVVIGVVILHRAPPPEPPQQIAQVLKSPEPVNAPAAPVAPPPAAPAPLKRKVESSPPPPPVPELQKAERENKLADQVQEANKPQAAGAVRQFAAAVAPIGFAFTYTVGADGFLQVVPASPGFLSVTTGDTIIYPSAAVKAGNPVRIAIPADATSLVIAFSRMQGVTGSPVRRDEASGTVSDQDPPNGRILIQLFLTPGTR